MISLEEAEAEVGKAVRRIALLHLAFAEDRDWSYLDFNQK